MPEVKLTPQQNKQWIETRGALLWGAPAFTHLLYSMMNPSGDQLAATFSDEFPIAATDGASLLLNPAGFFPLSLQERVFVVAHEIMHCVLNHCYMMKHARMTGKIKYPDGTELPYNHDTMNVAMDLVINDLLIESKIGTFIKGGCHDKSMATYQDSCVDAYRKIYNKDTSSMQSFDVILDPNATSQGKGKGTGQDQRSQTEWDTAIAGAMASAKLQGKLPAALEKMFGDMLEPEITWSDHIKSFFARKVGGGSYDWRKPDRRLIQRDIYAPARMGHGAGDVVVAIDTSGSIGQRELDVFFAELKGILTDVRPQRVHVVWCDAKVHKVDEVEDANDIDGLKPHGGGGTDFRPVFEWIDGNLSCPDALVYLTDGLGNFPDHTPDYPVLWGDIYGRVKFPFGDVVTVPIK